MATNSFSASTPLPSHSRMSPFLTHVHSKQCLPYTILINHILTGMAENLRLAAVAAMLAFWLKATRIPLKAN
jgi:hypothetical protein